MRHDRLGPPRDSNKFFGNHTLFLLSIKICVKKCTTLWTFGIREVGVWQGTDFYFRTFNFTRITSNLKFAHPWKSDSAPKLKCVKESKLYVGTQKSGLKSFPFPHPAIIRKVRMRYNKKLRLKSVQHCWYSTSYEL